MYLLAGAIMRLHIKAALPYTVNTGYIRCTSLLVQLCVYTSKPHFLTQFIQAAYAVPPCWCNYAFTHQSRTSLHILYRLHTLYLLAGAIMRLHIKAALPYTVHTGYIRCTSLLVQLCVYTSKPHFLTQCIQATRCASLLVQLCAYTSKPHFLAQCIQAIYTVPPCWYSHAFTHQSRTSLHSVYRLHTLYLLAGAIMRLHCNYSFTHESCTSSPVLKIIDVFCLAMYFRLRSHAKPAGGETGTKGDKEQSSHPTHVRNRHHEGTFAQEKTSYTPLRHGRHACRRQ